MTDRALLQQALEVLERYGGVDQRACDAEEALRERLAQPEQEPVAWITPKGIEYGPLGHSEPGTIQMCFPLYTTPPQRKPLTDEEIDKLPWEPHEGNPMTFAEGLRYFARAIEAAHGIKGEA